MENPSASTADPEKTGRPAAARHLVVLGHPKPGSFNHQVAETYREVVTTSLQHADVRDLYALQFDPLLRAEEVNTGQRDAELALVHACDVLVFVYPIWFGTPPAIIKGYVERILGADFQPEQLRDQWSIKPFANKRFLTISSSGTSLPWLNESGQWNSLRQAFDRYLAALFGFRSCEHVHLESVVAGSDEHYLRQLLWRVSEAARYLCAEINQERHLAAAETLMNRKI